LGFFLKIRYEIIVAYKIAKSSWRTLYKFLDKTIRKLDEKGADIEDIDKVTNSLKKVEIKKPKYETVISSMPIKTLYWQFVLVFMTIVQISIYISRYLFFSK
jgi:hypothetical protein